MKNFGLAICIFLFLSSTAGAQNREKYNELVGVAWKQFEAKEYLNSANTYKLAFDQLERKAYPAHRYVAASAYAQAGIPDSAFYHLFRLATSKSKYRDYSTLSNDSNFIALRDDSRWTALLKEVKANKDEYEKDFDHSLVAILDSVYQLDQEGRQMLGEIEEKFGRESDEVKQLWAKIYHTDSLNLSVVSKILDERGWLGPKTVGKRGASAIFLVIQHADLATQLKYLPLMREAVKSKQARGSSLALLEDRVAIRQGRKQIYGSQISRDTSSGEYFVSPIQNPEEVNQRRAEVGLPPLEIYTQHWGFEWSLEKHKKRH